MIETMKALIKDKDLCVLATASGGQPHCSLMAYVANQNCSEIHMVTLRNTVKYRNLEQNPAVSLLLDTREEHSGPLRQEALALTVSGRFQVIEDPNEADRAQARLLERHPQLQELLENPDSVIFSVRISSLLLLRGTMEAYFEEM